MKYISLAGAHCCTKPSKARGSGYAAVHGDGSQRLEFGDERYLHPRSPRPSRPLHAPQTGPRKVAMRPSPLPSERTSCPPPRQWRSRPPLYLARRSAAPPSPSRGPHRQRLPAAGSIAPQAGRSHAALSGSDALPGRRRAVRAALATRPPGLGARVGSSLGWLLVLRTRRCDAQARRQYWVSAFSTGRVQHDFVSPGE